MIIDAWGQHPTLRCITELGFKAIRVLPCLWRLRPTDRLFYPVYAACCELGVPFCTQIGHTGPLILRGHGRHKVLFGTNYPMLTPGQALQGLDALGLDEKTQALFLGQNAARVFGLAASGA
jgi:predicted TIM-barrel fold metal-dependent hydrolase